MWHVWTGADRRCDAIVLEVLGWVGLVIGELHNLELVGVGENHRWSDDGVNLFLLDLVHHLQFADMPLENSALAELVGEFLSNST